MGRPPKKTGVELELLTDYDQHLFVEKGMRGGISMVSKRYAKANNSQVEDYDPEKPSSHILYLDANNLYGWAMSQALPIRDFQWVDVSGLAETIAELPADNEEGYILEVDMEYPAELHKAHNAYPLAPERLVVKKEWMSEYQRELLDGALGGAPTEVEKLVPNLRNKDRYVLHYRNLQLYMSLGMRLTKIHRALRFQQSPWMEPYIRMNTELRKKATSDFEKDLYKLMNNSVFGKTMENLRRRVDVKLVRANEEDKLRRLIASPAFARANIFDDDLAAVQMQKSRLVLNRPIYVGMSILDLSKTLMYDFYYKRLQRQYEDRCQLLYTDTNPAPENRDRGYLRGHHQAPGYLRHVRLPERPPAAQHREQEGSRKDEGRVRRAVNRRICGPAAEDVLHPPGIWKEHQEGQGCEKSNCQEAHQA